MHKGQYRFKGRWRSPKLIAYMVQKMLRCGQEHFQYNDASSGSRHGWFRMTTSKLRIIGRAKMATTTATDTVPLIVLRGFCCQCVSVSVLLAGREGRVQCKSAHMARTYRYHICGYVLHSSSLCKVGNYRSIWAIFSVFLSVSCVPGSLWTLLASSAVLYRSFVCLGGHTMDQGVSVCAGRTRHKACGRHFRAVVSFYTALSLASIEDYHTAHVDVTTT